MPLYRESFGESSWELHLNNAKLKQTSKMLPLQTKENKDSTNTTPIKENLHLGKKGTYCKITEGNTSSHVCVSKKRICKSQTNLADNLEDSPSKKLGKDKQKKDKTKKDIKRDTDLTSSSYEGDNFKIDEIKLSASPQIKEQLSSDNYVAFEGNEEKMPSVKNSLTWSVEIDYYKSAKTVTEEGNTIVEDRQIDGENRGLNVHELDEYLYEDDEISERIDEETEIEISENLESITDLEVKHNLQSDLNGKPACHISEDITIQMLNDACRTVSEDQEPETPVYDPVKEMACIQISNLVNKRIQEYKCGRYRQIKKPKTSQIFVCSRIKRGKAPSIPEQSVHENVYKEECKYKTNLSNTSNKDALLKNKMTSTFDYCEEYSVKHDTTDMTANGIIYSGCQLCDHKELGQHNKCKEHIVMNERTTEQLSTEQQHLCSFYKQDADEEQICLVCKSLNESEYKKTHHDSNCEECHKAKILAESSDRFRNHPQAQDYNDIRDEYKSCNVSEPLEFTEGIKKSHIHSGGDGLNLHPHKETSQCLINQQIKRLCNRIDSDKQKQIDFSKHGISKFVKPDQFYDGSSFKKLASRKCRFYGPDSTSKNIKRKMVKAPQDRFSHICSFSKYKSRKHYGNKLQEVCGENEVQKQKGPCTCNKFVCLLPCKMHDHSTQSKVDFDYNRIAQQIYEHDRKYVCEEISQYLPIKVCDEISSLEPICKSVCDEITPCPCETSFICTPTSYHLPDECVAQEKDQEYETEDKLANEEQIDEQLADELPSEELSDDETTFIELPLAEPEEGFETLQKDTGEIIHVEKSEVDKISKHSLEILLDESDDAKEADYDVENEAISDLISEMKKMISIEHISEIIKTESDHKINPIQDTQLEEYALEPQKSAVLKKSKVELMTPQKIKSRKKVCQELHSKHKRVLKQDVSEETMKEDMQQMSEITRVCTRYMAKKLTPICRGKCTDICKCKMAKLIKYSHVPQIESVHQIVLKKHKDGFCVVVVDDKFGESARPRSGNIQDYIKKNYEIKPKKDSQKMSKDQSTDFQGICSPNVSLVRCPSDIKSQSESKLFLEQDIEETSDSVSQLVEENLNPTNSSEYELDVRTKQVLSSEENVKQKDDSILIFIKTAEKKENNELETTSVEFVHQARVENMLKEEQAPEYEHLLEVHSISDITNFSLHHNLPEASNVSSDQTHSLKESPSYKIFEELPVPSQEHESEITLQLSEKKMLTPQSSTVEPPQLVKIYSKQQDEVELDQTSQQIRYVQSFGQYRLCRLAQMISKNGDQPDKTVFKSGPSENKLLKRPFFHV